MGVPIKDAKWHIDVACITVVIVWSSSKVGSVAVNVSRLCPTAYDLAVGITLPGSVLFLTDSSTELLAEL